MNTTIVVINIVQIAVMFVALYYLTKAWIGLNKLEKDLDKLGEQLKEYEQ